jgi:hypothetical protein
VDRLTEVDIFPHAVTVSIDLLEESHGFLLGIDDQVHRDAHDGVVPKLARPSRSRDWKGTRPPRQSARAPQGWWADSTDRRNTSIEEDVVARGRARAALRAGRPPLRSPGRPPASQRAERLRFWRLIAKGLTSEDAAVAVGVSPVLGTRWFRQGGGMPPIALEEPSGRYLSFAERPGMRSAGDRPPSGAGTFHGLA